MSTPETSHTVPPHVPSDRIHAFDIYHDPRLMEDLHLGYLALQQAAPELFFTPLNGGHWVATRYELIQAVIRDHERFSNRELEIPKTSSPFRAIPINLDPPEHTPYRIMLMRHFTPAAIAGLEGSMRRWADVLIDRVQNDGQCDFAETLGAGFPVTVFMEMAGMPLERFDEFRDIVTEFFSHVPRERRIELQQQIFREMEALVRARMDRREDDLISRLIDDRVEGRALTMDELLSIMFLLFVAGLDTVANALTMAFHFLAGNPDMQDRLRNNTADIPNFIEESMRRFPITNGVRVVRKDMEFAGAQLKAGDMIVAPMTLAGLDDRRNPDPVRFDIDRRKREHISFSTGPHLCLGHVLARAEMRIFIEVFLARIPRFRLQEGFKPPFRAGIVMALESLPIAWTAPAKA